jgi:tetratricopeptide (TPR) repeat protein
MHWLSVALAARGELPEADDTAAALMALAEDHGDRPALLNAMRSRGLLLLMMGRPIDAYELMERAVKGFSTSGEVDRAAALASGQDAGVAGLAVLSWALWVLGYPDKAAAQMTAAFQRAEMVRHPHTDAYAQYYAAVLYALRKEPAIAYRHADRCLSLSEEHGFLHWRGLSRAIRAICATVLDPSSREFEEAGPALDEYLGAGYRFGITALYVLLCAPLFLRDQSKVVLDIIEKGFSVVNNNQERLFEAEFYRLHARALLVGGKAGAAMDARSRLEQALTIARSQKARSLELRAAHDLALILREQGRRDEAHDALAPIYRWFTEGFNTPDAIAAKALLADLSKTNPICNSRLG